MCGLAKISVSEEKLTQKKKEQKDGDGDVGAFRCWRCWKMAFQKFVLKLKPNWLSN
jgi:hypothetical protein